MANRRKKVVSADVARVAGVSRTTVSLVLNNVAGTNISKGTRRRVLEAARQLEYYPHAAARSLASRRSGNIGVVLCQSADRLFADVFLMEVLHGIHEVIRPQGFHILLEAVEDVSAPDAYFGLVQSQQIDGLIVSGPRSDDLQLLRIQENGFPVVLEGQLPGSDLPQVDVDNVGGARLALEHLLSLSHRQIAFISNGPLIYTASRDRLHGYRAALLEAGLSYDESLVRFGEFSRASGHAAMQSLLTLPDRPTAVFVASDLVAFGVLTALREAGLQVPNDMAVVGFDDVRMAAYVTPPLTSVHLPARKLGQTAAETLLRLLAGEEVEKQPVLLDSELIIRESSGKRVNSRSARD
ncbi:MAG: LacI family DNA-binding transcriptional regulator [Candidatus Binatia bacterium]